MRLSKIVLLISLISLAACDNNTYSLYFVSTSLDKPFKAGEFPFHVDCMIFGSNFVKENPDKFQGFICTKKDINEL